MAKINRAKEYATSQLKTAGKLKSLQILHEGGVRFLREGLLNNDLKKVNIIKAQNILAQLQMSLRLKEEDLAEVIFLLYDYIYRLLETGDDKSIKNAIELFEHLSLTFRLMGRIKTKAA